MTCQLRTKLSLVVVLCNETSKLNFLPGTCKTKVRQGCPGGTSSDGQVREELAPNVLRRERERERERRKLASLYFYFYFVTSINVFFIYHMYSRTFIYGLRIFWIFLIPFLKSYFGSGDLMLPLTSCPIFGSKSESGIQSSTPYCTYSSNLMTTGN
jgi:hypothetical protein